MLQKFHITLYAIIAGLFSVLFSPYTAVANDGKEPPYNNIGLLNKASQESRKIIPRLWEQGVYVTRGD